MSRQIAHEHIEMVPIAQINVLNPRSRNRRVHQEIIDNIDSVGLKRPIVVSRSRQKHDRFRFDLICGQGRIEAFQKLGLLEIPSFVIDADPEHCLMLSVVENVARRHHRPIDQMREIGELRVRGNSDTQIASMIGVTTSWVNMIAHLLDHGEERLLDAVECELIDINSAIDISRGSDADVQNFLMDEYKRGLKGKKLSRVRKLVEQRLTRKKRAGGEFLAGGKKLAHRESPDELRRIYKRETAREQLLAKKAKVADRSVACAVRVLSELLSDSEFHRIFHLEKLFAEMPEILKTRITIGASA